MSNTIFIILNNAEFCLKACITAKSMRNIFGNLSAIGSISS
jgi:hypothetical protein